MTLQRRQLLQSVVALTLVGTTGCGLKEKKRKEEAEKERKKNLETAGERLSALRKLVKGIPQSEADTLTPPKKKDATRLGLENLAVAELGLLKVVLAKDGEDEASDHPEPDYLRSRGPTGTDAWLDRVREELKEKKGRSGDLGKMDAIVVIVADRLVSPLYAGGSYSAGAFEGRAYLLDLENEKRLGGARFAFKMPDTLDYSYDKKDSEADLETLRSNVVYGGFAVGVADEARYALGAKRPEKSATKSG